ncbi:putative outer membrane protein [Pseudopedobacter saltans DSM 12145]|uniref:Outer membrane protein n=1 Tax=Pseudopedobacter saltans (strain ATCC 51119 / DSM 12145 / JCM 21818 / CCUG 39354 / LMG 10337 / NBRC 100064 / NCIMB 13643) TaxID=762903 RepID=F0SDT4_PSESL|nr:DUF4142 domain-containing protein [Pseudopedobacter saltans]ADY51830.1 putative outer membrane protein [Pseudopedobacter saltans DSM 12145]
MKKYSFLSLPIALLICQACINNNNRKTDSKSDTLKESTVLLNESSVDGDAAFFLKQAAAGGIMEVEAAKVALKKTKNKQVTDFARMMLTDHSNINKTVKQLASDKKIILPEELDPEHKAHIDKLNSLSESNFDKEYIDMMVEDHRKDIKMFEDYYKSLRDKDILNLIQQTLPILKKHAEAVERIKRG